MKFLFAACVVAVFVIVFLIIGVSIERLDKRFHENKRVGKAEIVGYHSTHDSEPNTLLVRILELNDGMLYGCGYSEKKYGKCTIGTVVEVLYAPMKIFGINVVQVYMLDNPPQNTTKLCKVIKIFALVLLFVAWLLAAIGLIAMLKV